MLRESDRPRSAPAAPLPHGEPRSRRDRPPGTIAGLASWAFALSTLGLVVAACGRVAEEHRRDRLSAESACDGPLDAVWALRFSPDGTRLASVTVSGRVLLEDLTTHRMHTLRDGPMQSARSLSFSGDGSVLAVAGNSRSLWAWDPATGGKLPALDAGAEAVNIVEFSPGAQYLATAHLRAGAVTVRDRRTGKTLAAWPGNGCEVQALAFSRDARRLCAAGRDGSLRVGDVPGGRAPSSFRAHRLAVTSVAFSPDGRVLASACSGEPVVRLWDPASGASLGTLAVHGRGVNAVAFSLSGRVLATAGLDGWGRLWDVAGLRELATPRRHGGSVQCVAFSPDGATLATGGIDGTLRLWTLDPHER